MSLFARAQFCRVRVRYVVTAVTAINAASEEIFATSKTNAETETASKADTETEAGPEADTEAEAGPEAETEGALVNVYVFYKRFS